jgi:hypothetical protein
MIREVIVWPSFGSTSIDRNLAISNFIDGEDGLLFEISLHRGDDAVSIRDYSDYQNESQVLIAASSRFTVEPVQ